jgi:hypothetical protein
LHGPRRPGGAEFVIEPAPRIDDADAGVDTRNLRQRIVGYRLKNYHFDSAHADLSRWVAPL